MNARLHIVRAAPEHLPALAAIELAAAEQFPLVDLPAPRRADRVPLARLSEARSRALLWIALDDGAAPAGFALAGYVDGRLHLEELAVHPSQQRRGLGAALVEHVVAEAREVACPLLTLTTFRYVPWNAPWYRRLGFRELSSEELGPELRAILAHEVTLGLDPQRRVALGLDPFGPGLRTYGPPASSR